MAVFWIIVVFLQCKGNDAVCDKELKMLRFIDLFAGIGGIRCGFEQAAWSVGVYNCRPAAIVARSFPARHCFVYGQKLIGGLRLWCQDSWLRDSGRRHCGDKETVGYLIEQQHYATLELKR